MSISFSSTLQEPLKLQSSKFSTCNLAKCETFKKIPNANKTGRFRNDHSIETKSPIKVNAASLKKEDLTFRNKTENDAEVHQEKNKKSSRKINKESLKIDLKMLGGKFKAEALSSAESQLLEHLWAACIKLESFENPITLESIMRIKLEIKKMLAAIAEENINNEAPLASSKKINLQNCLTHSNCDKEVNQKEFETESEQNEEDIEIVSAKTVKSNFSKETFLENYSECFSGGKGSNAKQELEVKKIMYMLEGKQKAFGTVSPKVSNRNHTERVSSLSSFNQTSNDDSGFTVFEIEKWSERSSEANKENDGNSRISSMFSKKRNHYENDNKGNSNISNDSLASFSSKSEYEESEVEKGPNNKRKVLNDIVAMLNQKYNKNIRLE